MSRFLRFFQLCALLLCLLAFGPGCAAPVDWSLYEPGLDAIQIADTFPPQGSGGVTSFIGFTADGDLDMGNFDIDNVTILNASKDLQIGGNGVTTTFTGTTNVTILDGVVSAATLVASTAVKGGASSLLLQTASGGGLVNHSASAGRSLFTYDVAILDSMAYSFGGGLDAFLWGDGSTPTVNLGSSKSLADGTLALLALTAGARTTDSATAPLVLTGLDAYPQAVTNVAGDDLVLAGGIGRKITEVIDYTQTLYTVTVTVNGSATVLTEGTEWTNATDNATSAGLLATQIDGISGVSAVAVSAVVHVTADAGTYSLLLAETGTGNTVTNSADGGTVFAGQILGANGSNSAPGWSWASDPNSGVINSGSGVIDFITDTSLPFRITATQVVLGGSVDLLMQTDATLTMGTGSIKVSDGATIEDIGDGAAVITYSNSEEILDVSGSETTTGLIPADAYDVVVCVRNTSTIVATTGVSYTVGISGGDVDAFGTGIVFTDENSTDMSDWTVTDPLPYSSSAREVVVAPDAGTLDTGTIQVVAFYKILTGQTVD